MPPILQPIRKAEKEESHWQSSYVNSTLLFGKKDLADLTSTIMADCTFLEQSFPHFIPELVGSMISTVLIAIGLFVYDWRMACAALWVLPVSFAIVFSLPKYRKKLNNRQMEAKDGLCGRYPGMY